MRSPGPRRPRRSARSAAFFDQRPVIVDLSALPSEGKPLSDLVDALERRDIRIIGVEAGGHGVDDRMEHCASLTGGRPGVLHGNRTYLLQDADGQILEGHSISAGLDYPGIGPEHAWLKEVGAVAKEVTGRDLMVNATGASAAILLAVGVPWQLHRGLAMISRAAGLVAHIGEEMAHPITPEVRRALRQASWLDEGESDE